MASQILHFQNMLQFINHEAHHDLHDPGLGKLPSYGNLPNQGSWKASSGIGNTFPSCINTISRSLELGLTSFQAQYGSLQCLGNTETLHT